jgi:glycosyltransferase involved in cell wall biosynthesis
MRFQQKRLKTGSNRRILIIAYAFWPMNIIGAIRPLHLVEKLVEKGYQPLVLTTTPWDQSITDMHSTGDFLEKVTINRTIFFLPAYYLRRGRRAILPWMDKLIQRYASFSIFPRLLRLIKKAFDSLTLAADRLFDEPFWNIGILISGFRLVVKEKVDCIFCTVPPGSSLAFAAFLARISKTPLVTDFRDLWTLNENQDALSNNFGSRVRKAAENYALASSAYVIYNTGIAKELMDSRYPHVASRTVAIPNGIQLQKNGEYEKPGLDEKFTICHIGSLYGDRDPADFLDGLKQWLSTNTELAEKVVVRFIGRGSDRVLEQAGRLGLHRLVEVHGHKTKKELLKMLSNTHLFLLFLGYRAASAYVVPAKFYDYLALDKPILACAPKNGEVYNLMREMNLVENVVTKPDSQKIIEILTREYERSLGKGTEFVVPPQLKARYAYSSIAERIAHVIHMAVEKN